MINRFVSKFINAVHSNFQINRETINTIYKYVRSLSLNVNKYDSFLQYLFIRNYIKMLYIYEKQILK